MSRIDAVVGTQVSDVTRPQQTAREGQLQVQQARVAATQTTGAGAPPPRADDLRAAAAQLKQVIEVASGRKLAFEIEGEDDQTLVVQVKDQTSGEVIKQIPSEAILRMRERLSDLIGTLFDEKA